MKFLENPNQFEKRKEREGFAARWMSIDGILSDLGSRPWYCYCPGNPGQTDLHMGQTAVDDGLHDAGIPGNLYHAIVRTLLWFPDL